VSAQLRFGLITPVVTLVPRAHSAWEVSAGPHALRQIAEVADRLGFHHVSCSEHIAVPVAAESVRGARYYDPAATLGYLAAVTGQIRLLTHVVVLPYHHPLAVAKRFGTLDTLSGGRLILGLGAGSLQEEFDVLGADFVGRGPRFEDALRALRSALGRREPAYAGSHYRFEGMVVDPHAVQARVPIWLGGRSTRSLRRALRLTDGWDPFRYTEADLAALLERARGWPEWRARTEPFDLVLTPDRVFDVTNPSERSAAVDTFRRYRELGATVLNLRFRHRSLEHYLEQLEICAESIVPPVSSP
jgi:probable F420-dependent oxidoreductase